MLLTLRVCVCIFTRVRSVAPWQGSQEGAGRRRGVGARVGAGKDEEEGKPRPPQPLAGVRSADNIVQAWGGGNNGNFLAWAWGPSFGK